MQRKKKSVLSWNSYTFQCVHVCFSVGKQVIHPGQILPVQEEFSPSQDRVQWAKELIAAFDQHQEEGKVLTDVESHDFS